jgi:Flp pilus assembly protein TadG
MTRRAQHGDEGSVSLMLAVLGLALVAVVGLVVDGGGKARARARADDAAAAAARCGTQAVDLDAAREGQARVDPTAAASRVRRCLSSADTSGDVTISHSGRRLHVSAEAIYRPVFLSALALGVSENTVRGEATVDLVEVQQGAIR